MIQIAFISTMLHRDHHYGLLPFGAGDDSDTLLGNLLKGTEIIGCLQDPGAARESSFFKGSTCFFDVKGLNKASLIKGAATAGTYETPFHDMYSRPAGTFTDAFGAVTPSPFHDMYSRPAGTFTDAFGAVTPSPFHDMYSRPAGTFTDAFGAVTPSPFHDMYSRPAGTFTDAFGAVTPSPFHDMYSRPAGTFTDAFGAVAPSPFHDMYSRPAGTFTDAFGAVAPSPFHDGNAEAASIAVGVNPDDSYDSILDEKQVNQSCNFSGMEQANLSCEVFGGNQATETVMVI